MTATGDTYLDHPTAEWITARMATARKNAADGLRAGQNGFQLAETLTAEVEAMVIGLLQHHLHEARIGASSGIAVLATGGFGRREFAPYSDLDLVFLAGDSGAGRIEELARAVLMPLWDAKVDAGHAVRTVREALELPATDLTAATALLDARFLAGDRALADHFLTKFARRVAGSSSSHSFVGRLRDEQRSRHSRFGDTIFLLEPDLKNGPGGIRDLCAGRWAALARFGTGNPYILRDLREMSARQAGAFEAAREWILRVRTAVHLAAGRRQDQLRFDLQEKVAPLLYGDAKVQPGEIRPGVAPAVEALMHHFQRHAKAISRETERLLQRAGANPNHRPRIAAVPTATGEPDASFELSDGALEVRDPAIFEQQPSEMIRLFALAIDRDVKIGLRTTDVVAEQAALQGAALRSDPRASRLFLDVLTDVRDKATRSRLEQMQDVGLLAALIPEWEPCTGRVQHDLYHVYTVDQHSLIAVAMLKALARGDHAEAYPQLTEAAAALARRDEFYLGIFLHDIGKPLGKNHSLKGAEVSGAIARQLGLAEEDVARIEFLVLHHLDMAHVSQRRDLDDPGLIAHFARICGDEEGLRQLFLLTFCDLFSTAPGNLTSWKNELLHDLYHRTLTYVRRGPELLRAENDELVRRRQAKAAAQLGVDAASPELTALFESLPARYFSENSTARIASHLELMRGRTGPCALQVTHQERLGYSELVLVADDVPGLLAKVAGVLFANRIDILDAAIYSRAPAPGSDKGEALDIFRVRKPPDGAVTDESKIAAIRRDLEAVLAGRTTAEALVASRPAGSSLFERAKPEVPPTEVRIDNDISDEFTVLDVFTEDRPGVLYTIARTLHEHGLDIHRSKVGVEGDRVADIFYVRDNGTGAKFLDAARIQDLAEALKRALPTKTR